MSKTVQQVELELETGDNTVSATRVVCWVDRLVKVGDIVSLRDKGNSVWKVINTYSTEQITRINRGWATPK